MEEYMGGDVAALATALAAAQAEIQPAVKDSTNPHFKAQFASLASVWAAIRPALGKHGLAVVQQPSASDSGVSVRTVLLHQDGGWIASECSALARDGSPQAVGSVITYLRRYGLAAMVGVVADEDDDANAGQSDKPQRTRKPAEPKPPEPEPEHGSEPATAAQYEMLDEAIQNRLITDDERDAVVKETQKGLTKLRALELIDQAKQTIKRRADKRGLALEPDNAA